MGIFDNIKNTIDETKDKAEETTGIDIDRDGNIGDSPPDSSTDSNTGSSGSSGTDSGSQSGDAGVDVDVSDEVQVDTDQGSSTFDVGDADGGSDGLVEVDPSNPTPTDQRSDGVEVIDSPSSSSSSSSQSGDAGVDVSVSEETKIESDDPSQVQDIRDSIPESQRDTTTVELNNADPQKVKDFKRDQVQTIDQNINEIRDAPQGTKFTTASGQTVSRDEALNQATQQKTQVQNSIKAIDRRMGRNPDNDITLNSLFNPSQSTNAQTRDTQSSRPITDDDPFLLQADAAAGNIATDRLTDFAQGVENDKERFGDTAPAEFGGDILAGLEKSIFDPDTTQLNNPNQDTLDQRQRELDQRSTELAEDVFGTIGATAANADDLIIGGAAGAGKAVTEFNVESLEETREDIDSDRTGDQKILQGTGQFLSATGTAAKEDPFKFTSSLAVDTAIGGAAFKGAKAGGRAATKAPDAALSAGRKADPRTGFGRTPRPGEPRPGRFRDINLDEQNTVGDFFTGNLQKQKRSTEGKEVIITDDPDAPGVKRRGRQTKENVFNTRENEDGVTIDPETKDTLKVEELSRTDFIEDTFDIDFSKGQAQLTQRPRQDTDTDSLTGLERGRKGSADTTNPVDRLQDVGSRFDDFVDSPGDSLRRTNQRIFNEPDTGTTNFLGTGQTPETGTDNFLELETEQFTGFEQVQEQPQEFEQLVQQEQKTSSGDPFTGDSEDEFGFFEEPENRAEFGRSTGKKASNPFEPSSNNKDQDAEKLLTGSDKAFQFDSSLGAELTGLTAEDRPDAFNTQDPLSLRPVVENKGNKREDPTDLF